MKTLSATSFLNLALALCVYGTCSKTPDCVCPVTRGRSPTLKEERYTERLTQYYSANAAQAPWCMVVPESTKDVSKVMKVLHKHDCPFGMRSGAHAAFEGSNGIKNGVTIDLGYMNATKYSENKGVASLQPGATWGAVFDALAPYGVVAVGGRADVVGVGGFTTGGGYSFHTGVRGFACDNVREFEVVLADGAIVKANQKTNHDLWKALKGGSGNFGIVTKFMVDTVPSADIYASLDVYASDKTPQLLQSYYDFVNRWNEEPESQVVLAKSFLGGNWAVGVISSNVKGQKSPVFDPFLDIDALQRVPAHGPASQVVPLFSQSTPGGQYANWQTGTFAHTAEMLAAMDAIAVEHVEQMRTATGDDAFEVIFQIQPITQDVVTIMKSRGGNVMGLEAVVAQGPANMYNIVLTANSAANQDKVLPIAFAMNQALQDKADELGCNRHWAFPNYAHGDQNPLSTFGAENIAFMKGVSNKYDPKKVFQTLRQTGFHLQ